MSAAPQLLAERRAVEFTVYGTPRPQGSMRSFFKPGMRFPVVTTDNTKLKPWRQEIAATAIALNAEQFSQHEPLVVTLAFYFARPKSIPKRRIHHTVKPDIDKLIRAVFDSLKGIVLHDDSQVVKVVPVKYYGSPERVEVKIEAL